VVLDRDRGGAYLSMLIASAGLFGIFLFLTYYLQQTLGYSPLVTGVAFLPISTGLILASNLSTIVLMPRTGPRPLVALGMLAAAGGAAWLAQLGPRTAYAGGVLGPIILAGIGLWTPDGLPGAGRSCSPCPEALRVASLDVVLVRWWSSGLLALGAVVWGFQAARRRTSQTVAAMSSTDSASSQPPSIHWNGQNRLAGW
jgi:hypothetical protein